MVTKRGKQASRKAAARKYGFLEVLISFSNVIRCWDGIQPDKATVSVSALSESPLPRHAKKMIIEISV
ncbi:MAG: hypothetical protein Q8K59_00560 [Nitrosomonas sp.]|nr:hypothetical protein [Nitrosomonas sp.]MDP1949594.1 hypothetical protein [Nitrosomonas sp.]